MLVLLAGTDEALVDLCRVAAFMLAGFDFGVDFNSRLVQKVYVAARLFVAQLAGEGARVRILDRDEGVQDNTSAGVLRVALAGFVRVLVFI